MLRRTKTMLAFGLVFLFGAGTWFGIQWYQQQVAGLTKFPPFQATSSSDVRILYVATTGDDTNGTGEIDRPFKTMKRAAEYIDSENLNRGVKVLVRSGEYHFTETLELTRAHSGATNSPTAFMNYPGEQVTVRGSYTIPSLTQVSGNVYRASLAGTPAANANFRFLYHNGTRILPARYPDHKPLNYSLIDPYQGTRAFTATDQGASNTVLKYRPEDAAAINPLVGKTGLYIEIDNNDGIWYWHERAGISSINTATREITLSRALPYNINSGNEYWIEGGESLLSAGEYYVDPATKVLTIHLPTSYKSKDRIGVPIIDNLVVNEASNFIWHGFKMEEFNESSFIVRNQANSVVYRNNEVHNGKRAFITAYDRNSNLLVDGNHVYEMEEGISVVGGMYMKNLDDSGNVISNNYIHHIDLTEGRGNSALLVDKEQAKTKVINNTITHTSRHGMTYEGPMHVIKNNYITKAGQLRMDVGGIYTGSRNLLNQGTLIEGNFVENIGTRFPKSYGVWEMVDHRTPLANPQATSFARMSDDWNSGNIERNNIYIQNWGPCISNHGGGYNTYENNYLRCGNSGFFFGGISVDETFFRPLYQAAYDKIQNMAAEGYNTELYYKHFPQLKEYPAPANLRNGDIMRNNRVINNVYEGYRAYKLHLGDPSRYEFKGNVVKNLCNEPFKALYEPITTPGTYSDLSKAQWQALGQDLDLRELDCSQPLLKTGTYQIDESSPAFGSAFQPLKPEAAGVKNVLAIAPTISLPSQSIAAPTTRLSVETKVDPFGYQLAEVQYQIRNAEDDVPVGGWIKLKSTNEVIDISYLQRARKYTICVRARNDALNLTGASSESLWIAGNCVKAVVR